MHEQHGAASEAAFYFLKEPAMKRFKLSKLFKSVAATLDRLSFNYMRRLGLLLPVARTVVEALSGATVSISATLPDTYDQAGYESTDIVFTAISEAESYGNHGMTATIIEFTPVDTAVVAKVKGSKNYGTMTMMFGHMPGNAGHVIVAAAAESNNHYSVKIRYQDGEVHYLDVLVAKHENQDGSVNDVHKLAVDLAICRKPIVVLP